MLMFATAADLRKSVIRCTNSIGKEERSRDSIASCEDRMEIWKSANLSFCLKAITFKSQSFPKFQDEFFNDLMIHEDLYAEHGSSAVHI